MHFAIYNLGTKLIPFKSDIYSNTQPHRRKPNPHWTKVLNLLRKTFFPSDHLSKRTFKSLYLLLLEPDRNPSREQSIYPKQTVTIKPILISGFDLLSLNLDLLSFLILRKKLPSGQPTKAMSGAVSFKSITLPLKPQMIFSLIYVFLKELLCGTEF